MCAGRTPNRYFRLTDFASFGPLGIASISRPAAAQAISGSSVPRSPSQAVHQVHHRGLNIAMLMGKKAYHCPKSARLARPAT
jgi:hypothetical protein